MELVRVRDRKRTQTQKLFHKYPDQEQEWFRTAIRELVGIPRDERNTNTSCGLGWAGWNWNWKGCVVRWLGMGIGCIQGCCFSLSSVVSCDSCV